ncbi:MAG: sensor histidine kinase [Sphingomicrobium sp.]
MRFDDRLTTVLDQPAATTHDRAVRWRQLVELAARMPGDGDQALMDRALSAIAADRDHVEERVRVATALAVASLPLSADLVASFAADRLAVAAPVLAAARLTASEWRQVTSSASADCRGFIVAMRADEAGPARRDVPPPQDAGPIPSISEVVARIERLRSSREETPPAPSGQPLDSPRLFRWECNEAGEIDWVEGAPRGAVVGQSIAQRSGWTGVDRSVERAFASRAPFHDGLLELPDDASAGGAWKISGIPAFERSTGRFAGYRGVAERAAEGIAAADPTSLRELVHEIKTPLNAIIGFAEIICGEYLGPADSAYRERAGEIVAQARLLLSAIDDLDFAARIHSTNGSRHARVNLGELMEKMIARLREEAAERGVELEASRSTGDLTVAVDCDVAERLIHRMFAAVLARADEGEHLRVGIDREAKRCTVWIGRPAALADLSADQLFGSAKDAMSEEFPLRLARGLAHSAGADIVVSPTAICLVLARP